MKQINDFINETLSAGIKKLTPKKRAQQEILLLARDRFNFNYDNVKEWIDDNDDKLVAKTDKWKYNTNEFDQFFNEIKRIMSNKSKFEQIINKSK